MDVSKLFNVLVLGGISIVANGCVVDDDGDDPEQGSGGTTSDGSGGAATTGQGGGGAGSGGSLGVGGAGGGGGEGGTGAGGEATGGGPLECSPVPSPTDPCGCPCCWADGPNTDEEICGGFCESGNDGQGCCGL